MGLRAAASVGGVSDAAEMAPALTKPALNQTITKLSSPAAAAAASLPPQTADAQPLIIVPTVSTNGDGSGENGRKLGGGGGGDADSDNYLPRTTAKGEFELEFEHFAKSKKTINIKYFKHKYGNTNTDITTELETESKSDCDGEENIEESSEVEGALIDNNQRSPLPIVDSILGRRRRGDKTVAISSTSSGGGLLTPIKAAAATIDNTITATTNIGGNDCNNDDSGLVVVAGAAVPVPAVVAVDDEQQPMEQEIKDGVKVDEPVTTDRKINNDDVINVAPAVENITEHTDDADVLVEAETEAETQTQADAEAEILADAEAEIKAAAESEAIVDGVGCGEGEGEVNTELAGCSLEDDTEPESTSTTTATSPVASIIVKDDVQQHQQQQQQQQQHQQQLQQQQQQHHQYQLQHHQQQHHHHSPQATINQCSRVSSSSSGITACNQTQVPLAAPVTPGGGSSVGSCMQKDYLKEHIEMEQMFGVLESNDIDLLQVIKSFESAPTGDGLCDLALFNDVDVMNMYVEDVVGQGVCATTPIKEMDTIETRREIEKRQSQMFRKCDFLIRRLRKLQTRYMGQHIGEEVAGLFEHTHRLLKRKDREMQQQQRNQHSGADSASSSTLSASSTEKMKPLSANAMKNFLKRIESVSSTQNLAIAKRGGNANSKLPNSTGGGGDTCGSGGITNAAGGSGGAGGGNSSGGGNTASGGFLPSLEENCQTQVEMTAGLLHTELRTIEHAVDSDATASSSGGESADEMVSYNNQTQEPLTIAKRAAWRWARDRAAVAARWSWLLAQIADLEYRIRQHNELHHQIKKNKGAVKFEEENQTTMAEAATAESTSASNQQSVNGYRGVLPGNSKEPEQSQSTGIATATVTATSSATTTGSIDEQVADTSSSCRTRPFVRAGFRKRKLLQTVNLHTISKKASRSSTIKCGCQWPFHPCALCTGRSDPTAPRDLPDMMPATERVALLDSCFHPVLSFPEDVSHSIHFEAVMRVPEWQNKVVRCSSKQMKGAMAAQKAVEREDRASKLNKCTDNSRRKYSKKFNSGSVGNKLKKMKARRAMHGKYSQLLKHKKPSHHRKRSIGQTPSSGSDTAGLLHDDIENGSNMSRSKNSSPIPRYERLGYADLRRNRNSYDIDNIVIPYSMAATTRVEILPYKEIPTPKWRIVDSSELVDDEAQLASQFYDENDDVPSLSDDNQSSKTTKKESSIPKLPPLPLPSPLPPPKAPLNNGIDSEATLPLVEDISDATIAAKHERAEVEERKKFQTYLKFPWSTRSRANRRIDSRAESSGTNTPDPMSPAPPSTPIPATDNENISTPTTTSQTTNTGATTNGTDSNEPATPVTPSVTSTPVAPPPLFHATPNQVGGKKTERRRTLSQRMQQNSRDYLRDERRSNTPDIKELYPAFEPLQFPLSDELYNTMLKQMPNDLSRPANRNVNSNSTVTEISPTPENIDNVDNVNNINNVGTDETLKENQTEVTISHNHNGNSDDAMAIVKKKSLNDLAKIDEEPLILNNVFGNPPKVTMNGGQSDTPPAALAEIGCDSIMYNRELVEGDSDTDSAESGAPDEDPDDPEWCEPVSRTLS